MEFKSPIRKGYTTPHYGAPLPIFHESLAGIFIDEYDWPLLTGHFIGSSIILDNPEDISVAKKGFFGKGSLSKGHPNFGKRNACMNVINESQWKRRKAWIESLSDLLSEKTKDDPSVNLNDKNFSRSHSDGKEDSKDLQSEKSEPISGITSDYPIEQVAEGDSSTEKTTSVSTNENESSNIGQEIYPKNDCNTNKVNEDSMAVISVKRGSNDMETLNNENRFIESSPENESKITVQPYNCSVLKNLTRKKKYLFYKRQIHKANIALMEDNEVLVIADIENKNREIEESLMNLKPHIETETFKSVFEVLYLTLVEAFFMSYALNCLQIVNLKSQLIPMNQIWLLCIKSQPDFIEKYVAYHYFRAKGWVVKSGIKFGGDYLLYKKGPIYFHASYIVHVHVLNNMKGEKKSFTWGKMLGMNRMAETANKEILICEILRPNLPEDKFEDPSILREYKVSEMLLRRSQPLQDKE